MIWLKFYASGLLEYFLRFLVFPVELLEILLVELFPAHSKQLRDNSLDFFSRNRTYSFSFPTVLSKYRSNTTSKTYP